MEHVPSAGAPTLRGRLQSIGLSLLVAVAGFVAGLVVLVALINALAVGGVRLSDAGLLVLSLISLQGIGFPLVAVGYMRLRDLPADFVPVSVPSLRQVGLIVAGWVGALLAAVVAGAVVTQFVPEPASNQAAEVALRNPEIIPVLLPLVILLNGPGEELLFRGVIQGTLRERFGPAAAIVLASLMFAPAHVTALLGASVAAMLATMSVLLVPSLVFGALYEYARNLVVPALVHGLYNATLFAALYASAVSGGADGAALVLP